MKKTVLSMLAVTTILISGTAIQRQVHADAAYTGEKAPVYKVYNPNSGEHVYTPVGFEVVELKKAGWRDEGVSFYIPYTHENDSNFPIVYRLYNPNAGDHHYTTSVYEAKNLLSLGWHDDGQGVRFPVAKSTEGSPVYRLYNPNAKVGSHYFTMSSYERDSLIRAGWKNEGVAYTAFPASKSGDTISLKMNLDQIQNNDFSSISGEWTFEDTTPLKVYGTGHLTISNNSLNFRFDKDTLLNNQTTGLLFSGQHSIGANLSLNLGRLDAGRLHGGVRNVKLGYGFTPAGFESHIINDKYTNSDRIFLFSGENILEFTKNS